MTPRKTDHSFFSYTITDLVVLVTSPSKPKMAEVRAKLGFIKGLLKSSSTG